MNLRLRSILTREVISRLAISLILAVALWVYATNLENPEASASREGVSVEVRQLSNSLIVDGQLGVVAVKLKAPRQSLDRLQASGAVRAYIDLSGLGSGVHELEVKVDTVLPISSYSVEPQRINIQLQKKGTRSLPLEGKVTDSPPFGYEAKPFRLSPAEISFSGPEDLVQRVAKALVIVSAQGRQSTFKLSAKPVLVDASGSEVKGLTTTPEDVEVVVPIELQVGYKVLPVKVVLSGEPENGYLVSAITVTPSTVTVIGDPGLISTTDFLDTAPVDITGKTTDVTLQVSPVIPQGISIYKQEPLKVVVSITAIQTKMVVSLVPVITGASDGVEASASPNRVDVTLSGSLAALSKLDLTQVKASLNVAGLPEGTHQVNVTVSAPKGIGVVTTAPDQVTVTVITRSTPTAPPQPTTSAVVESLNPAAARTR